MLTRYCWLLVWNGWSLELTEIKELSGQLVWGRWKLENSSCTSAASEVKLVVELGGLSVCVTQCSSVRGDFQGHDWSKSDCSQVHLLTCCDYSLLIWDRFLQTICNFPEGSMTSISECVSLAVSGEVSKGMIDQNPSVCKSIRLHVAIIYLFLNWGRFHRFLQTVRDFPEVLMTSNSTSASITSSWHSPPPSLQ